MCSADADGPEPDISVVVPAFDREATIDRTVTSVMAQGGCRFELIVVDDGSRDATASRAEELARQHRDLRVIRQVNQGVSAARNAGARAARGRYLTFLDCDDEVAPGWLAAYVGALDDGNDLVFSPGRALRVDGSSRTWDVVPLGPAYGSIDGLFNAGMVAFRRTTFLAAGGYAVGMRFSENADLGLRLTAHLRDGGRAVRTRTIAEHFVHLHLAPDGRSRADSPAARFEGALLILDQHEAALRLDPRLHNSYWSIAGIAAARLRRPADARHCFVRAWRARPTPRSTVRIAAVTIPPVRARLWPSA